MAQTNLIPKTWAVPTEFLQRIGHQSGRQRAMLADGHLLIILHRPPNPDEVARAGRLYWRNPQGEWRSTEAGPGPDALNRHLDEFGRKLDELDVKQREAKGAGDILEILKQLSPLRVCARNMFAALQQARELVPGDRDIIDARDRASEFERAYDLEYQDARNSLDFFTARNAEELSHLSRQTAQSAHRLNLLAAYFLPLMTLSTVFGMNLATGIETLLAPLPFIATVVFALFVGFFLHSAVAAGRAFPQLEQKGNSRRQNKISALRR